MLNIYNSSAQSVATNGMISYDTDRVNQGIATSHAIGSNIFTLNYPGIYEVTFTAAAASATTDEPITVQLVKNGILVPGVIGETSSTAITDFQELSFSALIEVSYMCLSTNNTISLTVENTGPEATFKQPTVTVIKVR